MVGTALFLSCRLSSNVLSLRFHEYAREASTLHILLARSSSGQPLAFLAYELCNVPGATLSIFSIKSAGHGYRSRYLKLVMIQILMIDGSQTNSEFIPMGLASLLELS